MTTPTLPDSTWRPVWKFPGYEVSDKGQFRYTSMNRILTPTIGVNGLTVTMFKHGYNIVAHVEEHYLIVWPEMRNQIPGSIRKDHYSELTRARLSGGYRSNRRSTERQVA